MIDPDAQWFNEHPDRFAHIRTPMLTLGKNKQRWVGYQDECEAEFRTLGEHQKHRRRILLWRVPSDNAYYNPDKPQLLKIPFLLFSDETVEDTDEVLLPIIHNLMIEEGVKQGMVGRA